MKINQWSKEKPDKACIVAVRRRLNRFWDYDLFKLYWVDDVGLCVAEKNNIGEWEDCEYDYTDWNYAEYMILDVKDGIVKKRFIPMIEIQKYFCSMQEYYQKEYDFWMIRAINSVKQHARHIKVEHLVQHQNTLVKLTAKLELMQDIINRFDNFKSIESEVEDE